MNEMDLRVLLSPKIRIIRAEYQYNQEEMAEILGISKKTLVQIEKERIIASWPVVITFGAMFRESSILQQTLGEEDIIEIFQLVGRSKIEFEKQKTMGGKVWWSNLKEREGFFIQQNIISKHYRVVDQHDFRYMSTFKEDEAKDFLERLIKSNQSYSRGVHPFSKKEPN
ncbi:helix-turn-helix transcriptional regulator [Halalkalibacillus sediminis]|uniref:helix-turn-helix transcriptional regulator n=1 Tax=Halalkalibacillus sediminis TaxID=2018042 RepID=UPI00192E4667|nr:transcriptional regulator [Halalkalibacillus sediminis]